MTSVLIWSRTEFHRSAISPGDRPAKQLELTHLFWPKTTIGFVHTISQFLVSTQLGLDAGPRDPLSHTYWDAWPRMHLEGIAA